jgi:trimeric autotransporter adhesin
MTNGIVYSMIRYGDHIYVGGKFQTVRDMPNGNTYRASNLARFHADTGVVDLAWRPRVTGPDIETTIVYALAAAGGKIWVGGKFDAVDGAARRNLAAVSPDTGVVDPGVAPLVGSETSEGIRAMVASSTKVYFGGYFTVVDGKARQYVAALDTAGNVDPTWKPRAGGFVRSLAFSCDGATVFAGGKFRNAAGPDGLFSPRETIARFDAASGALDPWAIPAGTVPNDEVAADLAVTCERVTAAYLGRNFARSFRLDNGNSGTQAWATKCAGDVQTVAMLGADKLIIGGHFSQVAREPRTRIAQINLSNGLPDPGWTPAVDGQFFGPWDLLVDDNHLYVGGAFTTVAGLTRTNFARFTFS